MPITQNKKTFGAGGEAGAAAYLESRGYRLVDANIRPEGGRARGEIDLVAWHGETLAFIEVKTRRVAIGQQGTPSEAIDARKRRQLVSLATVYLAKHELEDVPCRFDVVEVIERPAQPPVFRLLRNAFDASDVEG